MKVLSVGSGSSDNLPSEYKGWEIVTLDIDGSCNSDIILDGRELHKLPPDGYDAVFCGHNLEHYYAQEIPVVLDGFLHVLKSGGFAEIQVPDLQVTFRSMLERDLELNDIYYRSPSGPVTFHDTIYGYSKAMAGGNLFYAHRCGFTVYTLGAAMLNAGFKDVVMTRIRQIHAMAKGFKR
jgi:hypothetical protein